MWRGSARGDRAPGGRSSSGRQGGRGAHQDNGQPCIHFQRGRCNFGARCRYSHDLNGTGRGGGARNTNREPQAAETPEQLESRTAYFDWKGQLRSRRWTVPSNLATLWADAVNILAGDAKDWHQVLIRDLVNRDGELYGFQFINATVALDVRTTESVVRSIADDFIKVMAHPSLLDCLSVSTFVEDLYTIAGGSNGAPVVAFMTKYCHGLLSCHERYPNIHTPAKMAEALQRVTTVAAKFLRLRQRVALQEGLTDLFEAMDVIVALVLSPQTESSHATCVERMATLRRMVELSAGRVAAADDPLSADQLGSVPHSSGLPFPVELELPGGRHNNDHLDIGRIRVYPTTDEILSTRPDFLPSTDFRQPHFHEDPVQRYLDTHFRLLRHDCLGPSIGFLHQVLVSFTNGSTSLDVHDRNVRAFVYYNASVTHISVDERRGFESHITFAPPHQVRRLKSAGDQQRWWDQSKRLEQGALACFVGDVDGRPAPLLFVVSDKSTNPKHKNSLVSENSKAWGATITAKLATAGPDDLTLLTSLYHRNIKGVLIDLPGLIPATFKPILESLQEMMVYPLPFREWIIPNPTRARTGPAVIPLPRYARAAGFQFRLDSILRDKTRRLSLGTDVSKTDVAVQEKIVAETGFDRGQAGALLMALMSEYALLQGPPGTGKSYLGVKLLQVLLASKSAAQLGPIIVICYTNHALDQFLQHIRAEGIQKVIRIGGRSRSSDLDECNLVNVSRATPKYKNEDRILGQTYSDLEKQRKSLGHRLGGLHSLRKDHKASSTHVKRYLQRHQARIYNQFFADEMEGFTVVGDPISIWLGKNPEEEDTPPTTGAELEVLARRARANVNSLSKPERRLLYDSWLDGIRTEQTQSLLEEIREVEKLRSQIDNVHNEVNRRALLGADVIGITTTGLARDVSTLRHLNAKVVICEEAAEVLEPHLIAALMPGVEHLIQIGDHQQLRPQINCRDLSMETSRGKLFQLDRSQFERLAVGQSGLAPVPFAQLSVQRRMRPEISRLIRQTMYPRLEDHQSVETLPDVVGMRENVFWLTHANPEDVAGEEKTMKSHGNTWEVGMVVALVRHIVRQGVYSSTDVAVLTPYARQLQQLRTALARDFEVILSEKDEDVLAEDGLLTGESSPGGSTHQLLEKKKLVDTIRIATVDNFQGEEAKVVIVSLVRSNDLRKVGFLKTSNRINVLLSRAQHGMYLIGNADTYCNVQMWVDVRAQLENDNAVGTAFELCCPRHVDTPIRCAEAEDFNRFSPDGGCSLPCDRRLDACGHRCAARCHSDTMHSAFACIEPCPRLRSTCSHTCPGLCGEPCKPCQVKVRNVRLPCGHNIDTVFCHQLHDPGRDKITCKTQVRKTVPTCGHTVEVACFRDVTAQGFVCPASCEKILPCGHKCPGSCGTCISNDGGGSKVHKRCARPCGRPYNTCGHVCPDKCHSGTACKACTRPCEVRCAHSRCPLFCRDACPPCIEPCAWTCSHQGICPMPCAAPCTRLPCDERCNETLKCGHQCPSLCGEICPEGYCQACGDRPTARVDLLEFKEFSDVDLNDTPVIVLSCGHFFTAESLDGMVGMAAVYTSDPSSGRYMGLQSSGEETAVPRCPDCKQPIRQFATKRYGRAVNQAVIDETSTKFHIEGLRKLADLETGVQDVVDALQSKDLKVTLTGVTRYSEAGKLKRLIGEFCRKMSVEQQPTKKLFDAVRLALRHRPGEGIEGMLEDLSLDDSGSNTALQAPVLDEQIVLSGKLAKFRLESVVLIDRFAMASRQAPKDRPDNLAPVTDSSPAKVREQALVFLKECRTFIDEAGTENLPRLAVHGIVAYARTAKSLESPRHTLPTETTSDAMSDHINAARDLLAVAANLCKLSFEGAADLLAEVEQIARLYERERYEKVTAEEIAAIKMAMVSGRGGIGTHSGHWYKCRNGHTFAIGECGMPMQEARCPECQAPIGGRSHALAAGVTRDVGMERP